MGQNKNNSIAIRWLKEDLRKSDLHIIDEKQKHWNSVKLIWIKSKFVIDGFRLHFEREEIFLNLYSSAYVSNLDESIISDNFKVFIISINRLWFWLEVEQKKKHRKCRRFLDKCISFDRVNKVASFINFHTINNRVKYLEPLNDHIKTLGSRVFRHLIGNTI